METVGLEVSRIAAGFGPVAAAAVVVAFLGFMWANLLNEQRQTKQEVRRARRGIVRLARRVRALELDRAAEGS